MLPWTWWVAYMVLRWFDVSWIFMQSGLSTFCVTVLRMWGGNVAENTFQITSFARWALSSSSIPQAGWKALRPYKGRPAMWIQWASSTLTRLILRWNPLHLCIRNPSRAKCPAEDLNNCSMVTMRCHADPALWTVTSWTLAYILCEYTGQLNQYWSTHSTNLHREGCLHWSWQLVFESES